MLLLALTLLLPPPQQTATPPQPIPATLFGLTVLNFPDRNPTIPYDATRTWDVYPHLDWAEANPARGVYDFSYLDKFLAKQPASRDILYTFGRTPQWASSQPNAKNDYGPGQCAPPADLADWDSYVRAIATHAAGRIKYWEIWNEPVASGFYCGDIPTMVALAEHASKIIKSIDPTALIVGPAVTGGPGPDWLATFLSSGGGPFIDIIAFHGYWSPHAEDIVPLIARYRAKISASDGGAKSVNKPLWDTEASWGAFGNYPIPQGPLQGGYVAKSFLLHWSQGVQRFFWYAYDGGPGGGGLWDKDSYKETPAATAFRETYRWMVGATMPTPCVSGESAKRGLWSCTLTRPNGYQAEALWIFNSTATVQVAAQFTVYRDLTGQTHPVQNHTVNLTDVPILLETTDLPTP